MTARLVIVVLLALAACGKVGKLTPVASNTPPPKPVAMSVAPVPEDMLRLPPQSQPNRVDDPVEKSQERPDDKFNLPPTSQH